MSCFSLDGPSRASELLLLVISKKYIVLGNYNSYLIFETYFNSIKYIFNFSVYIFVIHLWLCLIYVYLCIIKIWVSFFLVATKQTP